MLLSVHLLFFLFLYEVTRDYLKIFVMLNGSSVFEPIIYLLENMLDY